MHFLLYDEMFDGIGQDSSKTSNLLTQICSHSYSPCTFQITQILLDRSKDLYSSCRKGGKPEAHKQDDKQEKNDRQDKQDKQDRA